MPIPRALAARLPALHEAQEHQEGCNVLAADLPELGVEQRTWPNGLRSVRSTGIPDHQPGNQVMGVGPEHLDDLPAISDWFAEAGCSMHLRWPGPDLDHATSQRLAALGLIAHEVEAWMAAPIDELAPEAPDHTILPVDSPARVEDFLTAFYGGWSIKSATSKTVIRGAVGPYPGPDWWRRYVAYVDGEPAGEAVLALFPEDGVAYLAEAATVPRFRKRGVQRALIARRIADARAAGAHTLFGAVQYGDASWSNMRALGLREEFVTVSFRRKAATNPEG